MKDKSPRSTGEFKERWALIVGFENDYEVCTDGRVRRISRAQGARCGRLVSGSIDRNGYPVVGLSKSGRHVRRYRHRLVAAAFLGPIPAGYEVNHVNGDPSDPRLEGLEIVTRQQNVDHAWAIGLTNNHGERCSFAKLTPARVRLIRLLFATGRFTIKKLASLNGVSGVSISRIVKRQTWVKTA